jgi:hypothetical protein
MESVVCKMSKNVKRKGTGLQALVNFLQKLGVNCWFITTSLLLRWPVIIAVALACRIIPGFFKYIFLVYPGTDSDTERFCPLWLANSWVFSGKPTIGGIISTGTAGRGLYFVVPNTVKQFREERKVCENIHRRLAWFNRFFRTKAIAIAGQGPGMFDRQRVAIAEPFVRGNKGTVFCIMETIREAMKIHKLSPGSFRVALVGVGYVGGILMDAMKAEGHDIFGIDIERHRDGILLPEEGKNELRKADMTIVLTPKGSDFTPYVSYLKKGAIVIDDTHPKIRNHPEGAFFYKVAVGMKTERKWVKNLSRFMPFFRRFTEKEVKFIFPLPGYRGNWIPGCTLEAMYSAYTGDFNGTPQTDFNRICREMGFYAHLVR